jgi:hypothetical protein
MRMHLLHLAVASLLVTGCTASGQFHSSAEVSAPPPLVYIDSDVQVIEDYQEPIFYSSSYYWRYDGGTWYRSTRHNGGWARVSVGVPAPILRIQTPSAYVHFHGQARGAVNSPSPVVAHDNHNDAKEERREMKEERKEERRDEKEERKEERKEDHKDKGNGKKGR